ncbi:hypothetical protein RUM44_007761 [Polyplax serrata]|uniref:Uncharacterized protein n=1 Tax=Polyplax serrata TaxID=468196 RepID=A0ABR1BAH3_POLSC
MKEHELGSIATEALDKYFPADDRSTDTARHQEVRTQVTDRCGLYRREETTGTTKTKDKRRAMIGRIRVQVPTETKDKRGTMLGRIGGQVSRVDNTMGQRDTANKDRTGRWTQDRSTQVIHHGATNRVTGLDLTTRTREQGHIDKAVIKTVIWSMSTRKAPGRDGVRAGTLRDTWRELGDFWEQVLNDCWTTRRMPAEWKEGDL